MSAQRSNKIPFSIKMGYGVGALSYGIPFQMLSGFFVFYASSVLGISGTLTGALLSASIIWDAFTDPVMGYISDKTSANVLFGRRLFYVMVGAVGIAASNYLLWNIDPAMLPLAKTVVLGALLILLKTFSTIYTTPYLALGSELTSDYSERTSVQSFRTAFFFLGFMFPTVIGIGLFFRPTAEYEMGQMNPQAYSGLGLTSSLLVLACAAFCIFFTRNKSLFPEAKKTHRVSVLNMIKETGTALKNNDFRNITFALLFVNMAMGIVGAAGLHTFTYTFGLSNSQLMIVLGAVFVMALIAQPIWVLLANRYEKRGALIACLIMNIVVSGVFMVYTLNNEWVSGHYLWILPLSILMGFSMGGSIAMPYAMISDTIDKDQYMTGTRKEGVFYGCATFMYKLSQALAVMFVGLMLDAIGFNADLVQPRGVYMKVGLILPIGLLFCFFIAVGFTARYKLNREKVNQYQRCISAGKFAQDPAASPDTLPDCPDR